MINLLYHPRDNEDVRENHGQNYKEVLSPFLNTLSILFLLAWKEIEVTVMDIRFETFVSISKTTIMELYLIVIDRPLIVMNKSIIPRKIPIDSLLLFKTN